VECGEYFLIGKRIEMFQLLSSTTKTLDALEPPSAVSNPGPTEQPPKKPLSVAIFSRSQHLIVISDLPVCAQPK
jgi:hypothetical protein